jgi:preprotein translocase subunit SecF
MRIFKKSNFDFLGKKTPFFALSLLLLGIGFASLIFRGGPRYGIDFKGGTKMYVKFAATPNEEKIRQALATRIKGEILVQRVVGSNEVIVDTEMRDDKELESVRQNVTAGLGAAFGVPAGKPDFHALGVDAFASHIMVPLQQAGIALSSDQQKDLARKILEYRDTPPRSGLISTFDELKAVEGVTPQIIEVLKKEFALSGFVVRSFEKVGPKIGAELKQQAINATLFALGGMLVYIALRFEWIYGLAAVLAVAHDTLITIGLFSVFNKEISLTVVAALLTLVGYSMNDTIVVFDRVRENLRTMRREGLEHIINLSINQTLSRTVMASGLTFMTVLALWLFGGETLNGFAFCLVVGILVGTYSSIFIASPIVIWYDSFMKGRKRSTAVSTAAPGAEKTTGSRREKVKSGR